MTGHKAEDLLRAALEASEAETASPTERAEMLVEIAIGLQQKPKSADQILAAISLYGRALALCPDANPLLLARITARKGTALQILPEDGTGALEQARECFETAIKIFNGSGTREELAEAEMNLGLVIQSLAGVHKARITDAIAAYQRSLRIFDKVLFPKEYAILQNNLATAFLSIPFTDSRAKMREALAVQAFEEGLKIVNLVDHPTEYAMLQNNLGNALQYSSSSHLVENNLRALDAYDEALKVRTRDAMPLEYANTISNLANCLWNLPDDPEFPDMGNLKNLDKARGFYRESREIFAQAGENDKARIVGEAAAQIDRELFDTSDLVNGQADARAQLN